ncbi:hypothetical protein PG985_010905 [Apiospora marii]|uniref:uncharacterized protein n=1 Tax=Apiospora marii TaxID=335849 RepID=UPI00312D786A
MSKTYIFAPNFNISPPPTGPLHLGDIITEPLGPELVALNRLNRIAIPEANQTPVDAKQGFSATRRDLLAGRLGLWASFLGTIGLPLGIEAGVALERHSDEVLLVDTLETHEILATDNLVRQTVKLPGVRTYLQAATERSGPFRGGRKSTSVYMVTGLKIARGASLKSEKGSLAEATLGLTSELADVQPLIKLSQQRTRGFGFEYSTPFVVAFRVRKIMWARGGDDVSHRLWTKSASMMDDGSDPKNRDGSVENVVSWDDDGSEELGDGEVALCREDDEGIRWIVPEID